MANYPRRERPGRWDEDAHRVPPDHVCRPPRVTLGSWEGRCCYCLCGAIHRRIDGKWVRVS